MFRLGDELPEGTIIGARGPNGVMANDNELNRWFQENFTERFGTPPVYSAYHMAHAILGLKAAYDKAAEAKGGAQPTTDEVIAAFENMTFESMGHAGDVARQRPSGGRRDRVWHLQLDEEGSRRSSTWSATRRSASTRPRARPAPSGFRPACRTRSADSLKGGRAGAAHRARRPRRHPDRSRQRSAAMLIAFDDSGPTAWSTRPGCSSSRSAFR